MWSRHSIYDLFSRKCLLATKDKYRFCSPTQPCPSPSWFYNLANSQRSKCWNFWLLNQYYLAVVCLHPRSRTVRLENCFKASTQGWNPVFAPLPKPCAIAGDCIPSEATVPLSLHKDYMRCQFWHPRWAGPAQRTGSSSNSRQNSIGRQSLAQVYYFALQKEAFLSLLVVGSQLSCYFQGAFPMKTRIWVSRWKCLL